MDTGIVSVRYARALLRYATENKEEDKVFKEMKTLSEVFAREERLQPALLNPVVDAAKKADILVAACGNGEVITTSTKRFIELVLGHNRAELMKFIAASYGTLYRKSKGLVNGRLTVPCAVRPAIEERLRRALEERTSGHVDFEVRIEPEIEGGFILEYDTYRLDASLRTQRLRLRRALK